MSINTADNLYVTAGLHNSVHLKRIAVTKVGMYLSCCQGQRLVRVTLSVIVRVADVRVMSHIVRVSVVERAGADRLLASTILRM